MKTSDRFNATVSGRATARRAGGLQVPVDLDAGDPALPGCLCSPWAGEFFRGQRVLVENNLITEVGR